MKNKIELLNNRLRDFALNLSVYDCEGFTTNELLFNFANKINEIVCYVNNYSDLVIELYNWVKDEGLKEEVEKSFEKLIDSNYFETIINETLFSDLREDIENNKSSIDETNKVIEINNNEINKNLSLFKSSTLKSISDLNSINLLNPYLFGFNGDNLNETIDKITTAENVTNKVFGIILPMGEITINKPIKLGRKYFLIGNRTTLIADYSNWLDLENFSALDLEINEGTDLENYFKNIGKYYKGIKLVGKNSESKETIGLTIRNKLLGVVPNENIRSLNYSSLSDIHVDNFKFGIVINELWNSNLRDIYITNCKHSLLINGQVVNVNLDGLQITNPKKEFIDNDNLTTGIKVTSKDKEPEGITFNNCLVYGCDFGGIQEKGYFINYNDCLFDGCLKNAFKLIGGKDLNFDNNYFCVIGGEQEKGMKECFVFKYPNNSSLISFKECKFVAVNGALKGFFIEGEKGNDILNLDNCKFESFVYPLTGSYGPDNSKIINNIFINSGELIINFSFGLDNTLIDGNYANNNVYFFNFQKNSGTSSNVNIGKNKSKKHNTYCFKSVTLKQGNQDFILDNDFYSENIGLSTICKVIPNTLDCPEFEVLLNAEWSKPQVKFKAPLEKNISIYYECFVCKFDR